MLCYINVNFFPLYQSLTYTVSISYLIAFLAQLSPLFGPIIPNAIVGHMRKVWSGLNEGMNTKYPCKCVCMCTLVVIIYMIIEAKIVFGLLTIA